MSSHLFHHFSHDFLIFSHILSIFSLFFPGFSHLSTAAGPQNSSSAPAWHSTTAMSRRCSGSARRTPRIRSRRATYCASCSSLEPSGYLLGWLGNKCTIYVCICICIYICVCVLIYLFIYAFTYLSIHQFIYLYIYVCVYISETLGISP